MEIYAYTALHYGAEYLEHAIRSTELYADKHYVFYTSHPSHGYQTKSTIPEHEREGVLKEIVESFNHTVWLKEERFFQEGRQRDYCADYLASQGADLILWQDADEIWDLDNLDPILRFAWDGTHRDTRVHAAHFWKGLNWVCMDACMPVRVINPSGDGEGYAHGAGFWHMGYAISQVTMLYKWKIHGHKGELRRNWYPIYRDWEGPEDTPKCGVHPTNGCSDDGKPFWVPEPFDRHHIEHLLGDHPYFSDEFV
jgi:hypothetical protein